MKGFDIIEAMNDIDSELLLAAKRHRKAVPRWIRIVSLAACLCCIIFACGIAFRSIFTQPEDTPGTAAYSSALEDTESTNSDDTEPQDSTEAEADFPATDTRDDSSDMEENLILPQDDAPDTVTIATSFTADASPLADIVSLFNSHHNVQVEVVSLSDTVYTNKTNVERYAAWCDVLNEDIIQQDVSHKWEFSDILWSAELNRYAERIFVCTSVAVKLLRLPVRMVQGRVH